MSNSYYFICYSRKDAEDQAVDLYNELLGGVPSVPVWIDQQNLSGAADWDDQISTAIDLCEGVLFLVTRDSVELGSECKHEWVRALRRYKPLFPLLFDAGVELPFRLASLQYVDFTEGFQVGVARLRRELAKAGSVTGKLENVKRQLEMRQREFNRASSQVMSERIRAELKELEEIKQSLLAEDEDKLSTSVADDPEKIEESAERKIKSESPSSDENHDKVLGVGADRPAPDVWRKTLRPLLHQVPQYTTPTYFLDVNLKIIDWNLAFELLFADSVSELRYEHVNCFIDLLDNKREVYRHANEFTAKVRNGELPLVDIEPLKYTVEPFGSVAMEKVAVPLHRADGLICGWAVTLLLREVDWNKFLDKLRERLWLDKLWSVYASSYDAVLSNYQPYQELTKQVLSKVPHRPGKVVDLGAGTGNCSKVLISEGHEVTAIENNLGMLELLRNKRLGERLTIVKGSAEHLRSECEDSYDAAVAMNVLYAVANPADCLKEVFRILKPGCVFSYSTTHADISLTPLLDDIKRTLKRNGQMNRLREHYNNVRDANREIERNIAKRFTINEYVEWTREAGFEVTEPPIDAYLGAVSIVHAKKPE